MWKVGDRILARRRPGEFWYPAIIRHIDDPRYFLQFEDGEEGFASPQEMTPCRFEAGDRVQVYQAASSGYLTARVVAAEGELLRVRYINQEEQPVSLSKVRIQPDLWKQPDPIPEEAAAHPWSVCDRVLACWFDLDWYPGIVLAAEPGRLHILLDTGAQALLPPGRVRLFRLSLGDRVMCRRKAGKDYYTGTIIELSGEKTQIRYDDGSTEITSARLLRLRREEWIHNGLGLRAQPGVRVLAQGFDLFWYPGRVQALEGKRLQIAFADGDHGLVTPEQVRPLDIGIGSRVFCRRGGGPQYLSCTVTEQDGDHIRVAYDGGGEELTSVRLVRVEK